MKITLAVRFFQNVGGLEKFSLTLADFLVKRGHRVKVVALWGQPRDGIDLHLLPPPPWTPRSIRDWRTAGQLANALNHDDSDIIFGEQKMWNCDVLRPAGGVEDEYWKTHARFRRYLMALPEWTRYSSFKRLFDISAERNGYRHARLRRVIVNSHLIRAQLLQHYPWLDNKIAVVHEGIKANIHSAGDIAATRQLILGRHGFDEKGTTALFVGHDFRRKGLKQAIQAVAAARRADPGYNLRLLVVGRDRPSYYRRLATALGVANAVAFVGAVSLSEPYFQASDLLLFPSFYDPFANVTLEALAAGLPVLTTRQNGGHEVIADGESGWTLEYPDDIETMTRRLLELRDRPRLAAMKRSSLKAASQHSISDKLRQVEELFMAVADEKRS
jgi:UDP-glucose:(heptosyl)LPS alpha-1,3-glucosyltransferase